jgi:hypothetical protein
VCVRARENVCPCVREGCRKGGAVPGIVGVRLASSARWCRVLLVLLVRLEAHQWHAVTRRRMDAILRLCTMCVRASSVYPASSARWCRVLLVLLVLLVRIELVRDAVRPMPICPC